MASLALYTMWFHKIKLDKSQEKALQKKVSNIGDVGQLDKYIRKI